MNNCTRSFGGMQQVLQGLKLLQALRQLRGVMQQVLQGLKLLQALHQLRGWMHQVLQGLKLLQGLHQLTSCLGLHHSRLRPSQHKKDMQRRPLLQQY